MFKHSVNVIIAIFSVQLLLVNAAKFKDLSYYQSIANNPNIGKFQYELGGIEKPEFDILSEFFDDWRSSARNDEQTLKCLVDHSDQISQVITVGINQSKACVNSGADQLVTIGKAILLEQETIRNLLEEFKTVIPTCASENKNATAALACIQNKGNKIHNGLEASARKIEALVLKGHQTMENTKTCLLNVATDTTDKLVAIIIKISECINANKP